MTGEKMTYGLPENYQARLQPAYFNDVLDNAHKWQADVYRAAALLAENGGIHRIVDIGCGRATKLLPLHEDFAIVGLDYGANIAHLRENYPAGDWHEINLENQIAPPEFFQDSVVICADVIEHLIDPMALVQTLKNAVLTADYVLLSTPDRARMYNEKDTALMGPPSNLAHVREWTLRELAAWLLLEEDLIACWAGWTISYSDHPEHRNTSLLVFSRHMNRIELPDRFQPSLAWIGYLPTPEVHPAVMSEWQIIEMPGDLLKVWMTPTPSEAARDLTNAINQIVVRVNQYLPEFGVQLVEHPGPSTLSAGHAGQGSQAPIHVAHFHGLYPTAQGSDNYAINHEVIKNLKTAHVVTAPSNWIADVVRRDMHIEPRIIGWGVDTDEWTPAQPHDPPYVLWNKARVDNVSNPQPMLELAARAHDVLFMTTFGEGTPNVMTIGRQPYEVMKQHVRHASVYLSTNVETFGIGLLEAMAAGVPILSFRQGAQSDYIQHGIHGFLAEPGDMEGLYQGLQYCLVHRERLGKNAREQAKRYTWRRVAEQFAAIYHEVALELQDVRRHRIDPSQYQK